MKTYFVQIKGRAYGPLDLPKLQALAQKGRLNKDSLVKIDSGSWQAANTIPEIFSRSKTSGKKTSVQLDSTDLNPKTGDELSSLLGNGLPDFEPPDFSTKALEQIPARSWLDDGSAWQQTTLRNLSNNQNLPIRNAQVPSREQADKIALGRYLKSGEIQSDSSSTGYKYNTDTLFRIIIIFCMILVILVPSTVIVYKFSTRNSRFQDAIQQISFSNLKAEAYYRDYGNSSLVFDIDTKSSENARKIDAVHLLLKFSAKIDLAPIETVYLARNGRIRYQIPMTDLKNLSDNYSFGSETSSSSAIFSLPEYVRSLAGEKEFSSWEGGFLGVRAKQLEQLNKMLDYWLND
jgi:hypothetical protein